MNKTERKKIIFMGTPDFAVPALESLIEKSDLYQIIAVISQPNRAAGRKQVIHDTPVAAIAHTHQLPLYQPQNINQDASVDYIRSLEPDLIITAAYGQIIRKAILDIPQYGCLNIHASLLPEYRGAAPIHAAIMDGKKETGITIMQMDTGMDSGDILYQRKIVIAENATAGSLFDQLARLGAEAIVDFLPEFFIGAYQRKRQDPTKVSFSPKLTRESGEIDWQKSAVEIERLIRGTQPWPGAFSFFAGKRMKIFSADQSSSGESQYCGAEPGTIIDNQKKLLVRCGQGAIALKEIQFESGKKMPAGECSHNFKIGQKFGRE